MGTKQGKMRTSREKFSAIRSHDPLIKVFMKSDLVGWGVVMKSEESQLKPH